MNQKKKIAIVGTVGVPAKYGGFETLAHNLVNELNEEFDIHVYASKKAYKRNERLKFWNNARVHYFRLNANGISSILYDFISMIHASFYADTIIVLGVSGGVFIPFIKLISKVKIVVNIDGLEWRRNKWSKGVKYFLLKSEQIAIKYSDADITDNLSIKRYTAMKYNTVSHMIAYGADHVFFEKITSKDIEKYPFLSRQYAFKVARIEQENNIEMILKAFSQMSNEVLIIVGNWKKSRFGANLQKKYSSFDNLHLLDPIYDQVELNKLRSNCKYYVHGHSAGGTNPALVEAMYLGLPIFVFDVSFNRATTHGKAIYFKDEADLITKVCQQNILNLNKVARDLKVVANQNYIWKKIANRYRSIIYSFDWNYKKPIFKRKQTGLSYKDLIENEHAHLQHSKTIFDQLIDY